MKSLMSTQNRKRGIELNELLFSVQTRLRTATGCSESAAASPHSPFLTPVSHPLNECNPVVGVSCFSEARADAPLICQSCAIRQHSIRRRS
jgi:hypothetical protein